MMNANIYKYKTDAITEWTIVETIAIKHKIKDISAAYRYTVILTENGEIFQCGKIIQTVCNKFERIEVESCVKFKGIKCGQCHTLLIDMDHELWSFGSNNHGQLGQGNYNDEYHPSKIKFFSDKKIKIGQIGCGADHNIIVDKAKGAVYCWGDNRKFQCGSGSDQQKSHNLPQKVNLFSLQNKVIIDIKAGRHHNVAKSKQNKWYLWGFNQWNQCLSYVLSDHKHIQMPREFKPKLLGKDQDIIDIIPGDNDTKVVTRKKKEEKDCNEIK